MKLRLHNIPIFFLGFFLVTQPCSASFLKISGQLGYGTFSASKDTLAKSEGPMAFGIGTDYDINSRWSLGAEHFRSLSMSPVGTSISMTGFTGRWYYVSPVPNSLDFESPYLKVRVRQKGLFPYLGWSFGFAQASVVGNRVGEDVVAQSLALSMKVGGDYPFMGNLAGRIELNIGTPLLGTGSVSFTCLTVGGVYFW
ncbi:MAG TPA: hypothetical protein PLU50_08255 [Pseudobdellovibrionaceae bacterium]|nr:hypothetical protein [Pseudobdellovibrionaceae bacterium]